MSVYKTFIKTAFIASIGGLMAGCASVPALPLIGKERRSSETATDATITALDPTVTTSAVPAPSSPPVVPRFTRDDLLGRQARNADELLGQPVFVSREGGGELRRYANQTCNLLVILYPDNQGLRTVRTVESTHSLSSAEKPDIQTCLNNF